MCIDYNFIKYYELPLFYNTMDDHSFKVTIPKIIDSYISPMYIGYPL